MEVSTLFIGKATIKLNKAMKNKAASTPMNRNTLALTIETAPNMTSLGTGNMAFKEKYMSEPSANLISRNVPAFFAHSRGDRPNS
jgi:hypothetical protein